jgi:colanic acid/amylovoran biosynthesis protein
MAYLSRPDCLGTGIGVNLRSSAYSGVDADFVQYLRPVFHEAARRHQATLVPVPISRVPGEADADTILQLLRGYDERSDGGREIDSPSKVLDQIQQCRIVVTGSYHAAVFALSQGTPVVAVACSAYYVDKFIGLAKQFGSGCLTIRADDADPAGSLLAAIDRAWDSAVETRPGLLAAAAQQIELSKAAYRKVYELVESRSASATFPGRR